MGLFVYIAGPMSKGQQFVTLREALDVADRLIARGHHPFLPQLSHFHNLVHPVEYERWMEYDFAWITRCDLLLRIPGESAGAEREVAHARGLGKMVLYGLTEFMNSGYWGLTKMPIEDNSDYLKNPAKYRHE